MSPCFIPGEEGDTFFGILPKRCPPVLCVLRSDAIMTAECKFGDTFFSRTKKKVSPYRLTEEPGTPFSASSPKRCPRWPYKPSAGNRSLTCAQGLHRLPPDRPIWARCIPPSSPLSRRERRPATSSSESTIPIPNAQNANGRRRFSARSITSASTGTKARMSADRTSPIASPSAWRYMMPPLLD